VGGSLPHPEEDTATVIAASGAKVKSPDTPLGKQRLEASVWRGIASNSQKSDWIAGIPIAIDIK
jgi:hypothetical protein